MKISVIVPVYKVEAYLSRCIDSILSQSNSDFELILVDDGSPDRCGEICDEYAGKDSRVTVIHQENGGLSAARNAGIEYALRTDSEWITFIDSDDWVHPEYLKSLLEAAEQYGTDIASCAFQRTDGEIPAVEAITFDTVSPEEYWCSKTVNATVAWGKLYRMSLFSDLRYPVGKIHEDEFTTYKCLFALDKLAVSGAELYYYYQNPNGIMQSEWNPGRMAAFEAFDEQIEFFSQNGYLKARKKSLINLLQYLTWFYFGLQKKPQDKEYKKNIQKRLRKELRQNKRELSISYSNHRDFFEAAYPFPFLIILYIKLLFITLKESGFSGVIVKISKFIRVGKKE